MLRQQSRHPISPEFHQGCVDWLHERIEALTDHVDMRTPVQWAEDVRYLPKATTNLPGLFDFDNAAYTREIVSRAGPDDPVREIAVMKGVQVCWTVSVLENVLGYFIDEVKSAPCMWLTADAEMAKDRLEANILPMLQQSGLSDRIQAAEGANAHKTGQTIKKLEWKGGGSLRPFGALNANKLRQYSILLMLMDEIDGWPESVGAVKARQGDPDKLAFARTNGYADTRKVLRGSTPLIEQTSRILKHYMRGDRREYRVPCKKCGFKQALKWEGKEGDKRFGLLWETEGGLLVPGSVRYACCKCGAEWINEDKSRFLLERNGAKWEPTARSSHPNITSYHIHGMLAPIGNITWEDQVLEYLEAWDVKEGRVKDVAKLQVHYNNTLGWPFVEQGDKLQYQEVVRQRRTVYTSGSVPNELALKETGGEIQFLTCAADIHKKHIDIEVVGHCAGGQFYAVDYLKVEKEWGDIDQGGWIDLTEIIEDKIYLDEAGNQYMVQITLVDSQWQADAVYRYCAQFEAGVFPLQGRNNDSTARKATEFGNFETAIGTVAYWIAVSRYKDRLSSALKREWMGQGQQPKNHANFPSDFSEQFFRELTKEYKREVKTADGRTTSFEWYRPGNADNHSWDITVYNVAAREIIAADTCEKVMGLVDGVDWPAFNQFVEESNFFRSPPASP